jgi:hypothetical protein
MAGRDTLGVFKRFLAGVLCCVAATAPVIGEPQAAAQRAGQVTALIPAATRNDQPATVNEDIDWNDLLKTAHSGRLRAGLTDGSILSVGSNSELRVVQHDAATQQTSLEMNFGKVHSQVQKITAPGGKFELKTPNAVIGVIGTDFYVGFAKNRTTVICYEGRVSVTPIGKVQVVQNSGQTGSNGSITVAQGQMVVITSTIPAGGFPPSNTPPKLQQSTLVATNVPGNNVPTPGRTGGHLARNITLISMLAAGVAVAVLENNNNGSACRVGVKAC